MVRGHGFALRRRLEKRRARGGESRSAPGKPLRKPPRGETLRVRMMVVHAQVVLHLREPRWLSAGKAVETQGRLISKSTYYEAAARAGDFILPTSFRTQRC